MGGAAGVSRREIIAAVSCVLPGLAGAAAAATGAKDMVDHLLLGVSDLDAGIAWVEQRMGVKAVVGGSHPGRGTRNALLSLGGHHYLELIAPDPKQSTYTFHVDVRPLTEPRLVNWAVHTSNLDTVLEGARKTGVEVSGPNNGSRITPAGKTLKWRTLAVTNKFGTPAVDPVPFFIEWAAGSAHPSQDSPGGCELLSLAVEHPEAPALKQMLRKLGIDVDVRKGSTARLIATVRTPKGRVELS
jgi:hypothetical protein